VGDISKEREVAASKTALLALGLDPLQVREVRVDTYSKQLSADLLEFGRSIAEGNDLRWADEGPIKRIEEEHHVLSLVIAQGDILECTVNDGSGFELRGWLLDLRKSGTHLSIASNKFHSCNCIVHYKKREVPNCVTFGILLRLARFANKLYICLSSARPGL
jgi:hypothetical protein